MSDRSMLIKETSGKATLHIKNNNNIDNKLFILAKQITLQTNIQLYSVFFYFIHKTN